MDAEPRGAGGVRDPGEVPELPVLPGFREMALRRMSAERRRLVAGLTAQRRSAGLSQTEVAARMGTSQSAVARLETGDADVRVSTLERYAAAVGSQVAWLARAQPGLAADPAGRDPTAPGPAGPGSIGPGVTGPGLASPGNPQPGQAQAGPEQQPLAGQQPQAGPGQQPQAGPGQEYR
jgi:DNA-binding XRE family transcriptional regulator